MRTFDQYGKMPPIPDMTEEKWNSLTELQKEEYISEYNTIREKDEELKRLRNKRKSCSFGVFLCAGERINALNRRMMRIYMKMSRVCLVFST